ncbi:hypothetical protein GHT06_020235 [Daphnia sinensis]|uniref:Uncharacterized protein n=1 Tax=Daphnia sinensis TaxID=1820382 RepID=A0AAD5PRD9_9CRUS|nr:hypothetical protein GHT06_020235 [Daphnia sinensis]
MNWWLLEGWKRERPLKGVGTLSMELLKTQCKRERSLKGVGTDANGNSHSRVLEHSQWSC